MKKIQRKLIGAFLVIVGLTGLFMAMNENANYINFIGVILFWVACCLGAKLARYDLHPIRWILDEWEYFKFWLWR